MLESSFQLTQASRADTTRRPAKVRETSGTKSAERQAAIGDSDIGDPGLGVRPGPSGQSPAEEERREKKPERA
jgi:hypothetical protein